MSCSSCLASNDTKALTLKDWRENSCLLLVCDIPEFSVRLRKTTVGIVGVPAEIRGGHLPNATESLSLNHLAEL
jgi:hypothetical protein